MPSFDIASKVQWSEIDNAVNQASKEIAQRFDFKDTGTGVEKTKEGLLIEASSEDRAKAAWDVLQEKLVRRKVSLRFMDPQDPQKTGKGGSKILVKVKEGVETEPAKKIIQTIKDAKLKVQASIQEAQVRVSGKNRDDLQKAIAVLRSEDFGIELQFTNFRD
ncbi:MAG: YajQ family cyclic di-GMP-binding protein [Polyangiaceae bacterium]|nr:YajQ family cyclic di-GMP-binding protein [Polyangiaceae bacterium]